MLRDVNWYDRLVHLVMATLRWMLVEQSDA